MVQLIRQDNNHQVFERRNAIRGVLLSLLQDLGTGSSGTRDTTFETFFRAQLLEILLEKVFI